MSIVAGNRAASAMGRDAKASGALGGSKSGSKSGMGGTNTTSVPYVAAAAGELGAAAVKKMKKGMGILPTIPDNPVLLNPTQDVAPMSEAPTRRPIRSSLGSFGGSAGITGYAGVFIP